MANELVKEFFEREKQKDVTLEVLPNGVRYLHNQVTGWNRFHEIYKPLTDEQIDVLQQGVNRAQETDFVFPDWYRELLKTTNGFNLFFDNLNFYGEQTPLVWDEKYKQYLPAMIERDNPDWMAPYDLRYTESTKYDPAAKKRWLKIGSQGYDGTHIVWDFKLQKIVAMYPVPVTLSIKAKRKLKEENYEAMIFAQWNSFDEYFAQETERLGKIIEKYGVDEETGGFDLAKKMLPVGHRDFEE